MADTPTPRNRWRKQEVGAKQNNWGGDANEDGGSDRIDESLDGVVSLVLSGAYTLTSVNFEADEARRRVINVTGGTGGTLTIPAVEKNYLVRNATSGDLAITNGSNSVIVKAGNGVPVFSDGNGMYQLRCLDYGADLPRSTGTPSNVTDLVTKAYADGLAFSTSLPGQTGSAGKSLTTNGATASWNFVDLANGVTGVLPVANGGTGTGSLTTFKTNLALNNVENKSSATIRAEFVAAANTYTAKQTMKASASGGAGFNLPTGMAPSSPAAGDLWSTADGLFFNDGTRTVGVGKWTQIGSTQNASGSNSVAFSSIPSGFSDLLVVAKGLSISTNAIVRFILSGGGANSPARDISATIDAADAVHGAIEIAGYRMGAGLLKAGFAVTANMTTQAPGVTNDAYIWRVDVGIDGVSLTCSAGTFDGGTLTLFAR